MPEESTEAPKAASGGASQDNNMAVLAHALGIIVGFIGPLIIYLTAQGKPYVLAQSKEALNFQLTLLAGYIIGWITSFIFIGFIILPVVAIYGLIMAIIAAMACSKGEDYKYPFAIRLIK